MEGRNETADSREHLLLEEIATNRIAYIEPPDEWDPELDRKEPFMPPVLITEKEPGEHPPGVRKEYTLIAHHRSFWRVLSRGQLTSRCIVVRSNVHIPLAHESITNCIEEALLFDALLRNGLCDNRSRLSEMLGYSRARITQILNLLKLPPPMRRRILLTDDISEFQLRPVVRVADPEARTEMFEHLLNVKLTGRQMAQYAEEQGGGEETDESGKTDIEEIMRMPAVEGPPGGVPGRQGAAPVIPADVRRFLSFLSPSVEDWEARASEAGASAADIEFLRGVVSLRSGLYRDALQRLEDVVEENPDHAPAHFYIGKCANLTGDLDKAENALRTALSLAPEEPDYNIELAIVLEKLKRSGEASSFYRKAGSARKRAGEQR